ncbi:MAG: hypothetical protein ACOX0R_01310 [Candidatus Dojkabacteria bacterium]|jgi:hypothetical protein
MTKKSLVILNNHGRFLISCKENPIKFILRNVEKNMVVKLKSKDSVGWEVMDDIGKGMKHPSGFLLTPSVVYFPFSVEPDPNKGVQIVLDISRTEKGPKVLSLECSSPFKVRRL